jgi:hypothetical protein
MLTAASASASGPNWAEELTGIGTFAVAIAAVVIALWSDRRAGQRLNQARDAADKRLAEERAIADKRQHELVERAERAATLAAISAIL